MLFCCVATNISRLVTNFFHSTDINECDFDNGGCSHNCSNVNGSYYCKCLTGYITADVDDHECDGMLRNIYTCSHI